MADPMTKTPEEDYRSAGFSGRIGFGKKPGMIVIDMMMNYFDNASPMYAGVEAVLASNLRLIEAARDRKIPLVFTQQFYEEPNDESVYVRKVPALKMLKRG